MHGEIVKGSGLIYRLLKDAHKKIESCFSPIKWGVF